MSRAPRGMQLSNPALNRISNHPDNLQCVDCGARAPTWASINLGVLMCIECSGAHRNLGVHITQVRSLTLDSWEASWAKCVAAIGNRCSNLYYEANLPANVKKPQPNASSDELMTYIRNKYEFKRYTAKDRTAPAELYVQGKDPWEGTTQAPIAQQPSVKSMSPSHPTGLPSSTPSKQANFLDFDSGSTPALPTQPSTSLFSNFNQSVSQTAASTPIAVAPPSDHSFTQNMWNSPAPATASPSQDLFFSSAPKTSPSNIDPFSSSTATPVIINAPSTNNLNNDPFAVFTSPSSASSFASPLVPSGVAFSASPFAAPQPTQSQTNLLFANHSSLAAPVTQNQSLLNSFNGGSSVPSSNPFQTSSQNQSNFSAFANFNSSNNFLPHQSSGFSTSSTYGGSQVTTAVITPTQPPKTTFKDASIDPFAVFANMK
eukprot:GDKJ01055362.1.p1 GENE.GDKJ01055362.1~~GDKJ01055362.1.p1  ORF type:complete len:430 (+),score=111.58 GDKJ01055362.1:32-1321(+)